MEENYDVRRLLTLRKLTRSITDLLREQLKGYLATLQPLLRPKSVFGDYIQGDVKTIVKGSDKAFKDLQNLYDAVAGVKPFNLPRELESPIEIVSTALEMNPMEYAYTAKTERDSKAVFVTSPLKWTLSYSGFSPSRLKESLSSADRSPDELKRILLHYMVMHLVISKQTGVAQILEALHFPISSYKLPEFGDLPITCISSSVSTIRPPDGVIIESTEISGMAAFEEIVALDDIAKIRDSLKDRLLALVESHGAELPS